MNTPGLIIDGTLVSTGRVPSASDFAAWLSEQYRSLHGSSNDSVGCGFAQARKYPLCSARDDLSKGDATCERAGPEGDLAAIRARELAEAAAVLGIARLRLAAFPDGALSQVDLDTLVSEIADFVGAARPDGVVAFDRDGVTGHPDHRRATEAAVAYASREHLPVLGTARVGGVHTQC